MAPPEPTIVSFIELVGTELGKKNIVPDNEIHGRERF
jgi:hypothetical protein